MSSVPDTSPVRSVPDPAETALPIRLTRPRDTVHARLPDGRIYEAPPGTPLGAILRVAAEQDGGPRYVPAVAAIVDGRLRELQTPLTGDADVTPVLVTDGDGARIYRRSLAFLLVTAASEVFPEAEVMIEHSAPTVGGYFCSVRGRAPFSRADLRALEDRMRAIVAADHADREIGRAGQRGHPAVSGSRRARQGAPARAPAARHAGAVRAARPPRLLPGIHGPVDRVSARASLWSGSRRASCSVSRTRRVRSRWRTSSRTRSCSRCSKRRASGWTSWASATRGPERCDPGRAAAGDLPRRGGAARGADREDRVRDRRRGRPHPRRAHCRSLVLGQDHLLEAAGRPVARGRTAAVPGRARRLLPGPRADAARRARGDRLRGARRPRRAAVQRASARAHGGQDHDAPAVLVRAGTARGGTDGHADARPRDHRGGHPRPQSCAGA